MNQTETKPQFSPLYAGYYNLIYRNKDYAGETAFVIDRAHQNGLGTSNAKPPLQILDLGSGTGRHALQFHKSGFRVHGVDLSEAMVDVAREAAKKARLSPHDVSFDAGDIRAVNLGQTFDLAVSLFHVMSYQTTDQDLRQTLRAVKRHLKPVGLFIFDFWHGPTVLNLKPQQKKLDLEDDEFQISRQTLPNHIPEKHLVNVRFELDVLEKKTAVREHFIENHPMRYFFIPELETTLREEGFELVESGEWMTKRPLGTETWNAYVVTKSV